MAANTTPCHEWHIGDRRWYWRSYKGVTQQLSQNAKHCPGCGSPLPASGPPAGPPYAVGSRALIAACTCLVGSDGAALKASELQDRAAARIDAEEVA